MYEDSRMGGYERIFPCKDEEMNQKYEGFIVKANELWDEFTTGGKSKRVKNDVVNNTDIKE